MEEAELDEAGDAEEEAEAEETSDEGDLDSSRH